MDFNKLMSGISKDLYRVADEASRKVERIDTGSYLLNAVLCGSIFGGYPIGAVTGLGGDPSTGKTFACLTAVKLFLDNNPEALVVYFDTEAAIKDSVLEGHNIDTTRVLILQPKYLEAFRTMATQMLDKCINDKNKVPMLFVLDSLGNLRSKKELEDALAGKEVNDMTMARTIKSIFRIITTMLDEAGIPMLVTNHQYANVGGYGPAKIISGGSGLKYCATSIISMAKSAEKEGKETIGCTLNIALTKGRHAREGKVVEVRIYHDARGWDRYYGLADYAVGAGIWEEASRGRYVTQDGTHFGKAIYKDPERFFTPEVLIAIDEYCKEAFKYGGGGSNNEEGEGDE